MLALVAFKLKNQVSDAKQCEHQDGKVTVPHEDFVAKLNAVRYAFLELGINERDLASQHFAFFKAEEITNQNAKEDDVLFKRDDKLIRPIRLTNGLYKFKEGSNIDHVILDCVNSLQNSADLLWIETPTPNVR